MLGTSHILPFLCAPGLTEAITRTNCVEKNSAHTTESTFSTMKFLFTTITKSVWLRGSIIYFMWLVIYRQIKQMGWQAKKNVHTRCVNLLQYKCQRPGSMSSHGLPQQSSPRSIHPYSKLFTNKQHAPISDRWVQVHTRRFLLLLHSWACNWITYSLNRKLGFSFFSLCSSVLSSS